MTILLQARNTLLEVLDEHSEEIGYRVHEVAASPISPPAVLVGAPVVEYSTYSLDPTTARFVVYAVEKSDARTIERLMTLGVEIARVVDQFVRDASVTRMDPGLFPSGSGELPAYEITVEMSLRRLAEES